MEPLESKFFFEPIGPSCSVPENGSPTSAEGFSAAETAPPALSQDLPTAALPHRPVSEAIEKTPVDKTIEPPKLTEVGGDSILSAGWKTMRAALSRVAQPEPDSAE